MIGRGKVSSAKLGVCLRAFAWHLRIRALLWRELSRDASHPVAARLRRQLRGARQLPLVRFSLAFGALQLFALAYVYTAIGHRIVWLLPVWLMLFSASYCFVWIARIVPLMSRQSVLGALDEISVIPPGRVFIYLTICKVVLNRDDAVVWLGLLRRVMGGLVLLSLLLTLCIALTLLAESSILELAAILLDLALAAAVIWLEHSQSTALACLLAIEVATRVGGNVDKSSIALTTFALAQLLCYCLALALVIVLDQVKLSALLLLFLLLREFMVSALWRLILEGANEAQDLLPTAAAPPAATVAGRFNSAPARAFEKRP